MVVRADRAVMSRHNGREVVMLCEECHSKMLAVGELLLLSCQARPVFTAPQDLQPSRETFLHFRDRVIDKLNHILMASRDISSQVHAGCVQWKTFTGRLTEMGQLVVSLTELSAHIAYLMAVNFEHSQASRLGVVNKYKLHQAKLELKFCCSRLKRSCVDDLDSHLLVELCSGMSRALSSMTEVCRHAGDTALNLDDQNQFKLCVKSITSVVACLIASVKRFRSSPSVEHLGRVMAFCDPVVASASALVTFASEDDFVGSPARLSDTATEAHKSVLGMTMSIVSASIQMCKAIRDLVYDLGNPRHRERIGLCVDSVDKASAKLRDLLLSCHYQPKARSGPDKAGSPQDKAGSPQDKAGSPQDKAGSPQDKAGSPQDKAGSPQDKAGSPQDKPGSPQDKAGSPQDKAGSPQDKAGSPQDKAGSSKDKTGSPRDKTGSHQEKTSSPRDSTGSPQDETGSSQDKTGWPQDKTGVPRDNTGSPQDKTTSPQDKTGSSQHKTGLPEDKKGLAQAQTGLSEEETGSAQTQRGSPEPTSGLVQSKTGLSEDKNSSPEHKTSPSSAHGKTDSPEPTSGLLAKAGSPEHKTGSVQVKTGSPEHTTGSGQAKTDSPERKTGSPLELGAKTGSSQMGQGWAQAKTDSSTEPTSDWAQATLEPEARPNHGSSDADRAVGDARGSPPDSRSGAANTKTGSGGEATAPLPAAETGSGGLSTPAATSPGCNLETSSSGSISDVSDIQHVVGTPD